MTHLLQPALLPKADSLPPPMKRQRSRSIGTYSQSNHSLTRKKKRGLRRPSHIQANSTESEKSRRQRAPRKLGPRDIGRAKYKGTKYQDPETGHWLDEKIHRHARASSFLSRKAANPVEKSPTVQEVGTPKNWKKPSYYQEEVQKMYAHHNAKRAGWGGIETAAFLEEKPLKPRDNQLDALKDAHVPKGQSVNSHSSPYGWKPIAYQYENTGGGFLDEKFWFEASHVQVDGNLSRMIEALPPEKKRLLDRMPAPTGYQSKINYLKKLRDLVMQEVKRLHKEDKLLQRIQTKRKLTFGQQEMEQLAAQIEQEFDQQIDDALHEVFSSDDEEQKASMKQNGDADADKQTKKKKVGFALPEPETKVDGNRNGDEEDEEDDFEIDVDDDLEDDDASALDKKYKKMVQRKQSSMAVFQRKLLTMQSVNKLTNLIDDMEQVQDTEH
mmetsp:Transcript_28651/g.45317  ORF Transcript_28651/g.45317 Transcript_28651/m.45317 type:complete len:440 (-) Transcript_28651:207-1526(-)